MASTSASNSQSNPWLNIWWRPQATIKEILSRPTRWHVLFLAAVAGMAGILMNYVYSSSSFSPAAAVTVALLFGPVLGILQLYIYGALTAWTGRLIGGRASQRSLRTALAWASIPYLIALPLLLGSVLVLGPDLVPSGDDLPDGMELLLTLCVLVLSLWAFFLAIRTIGAVQGFGLVRSFLNWLVPPLLLFVAVGLFRAFLFQPFNIPAGSMEPTLRIGDHIFVDKRAYGYSRYSSPFGLNFAGRMFPAEPERGDIVVFKLPRDNTTDYVKRIVGLPGETIAIKNGVLVIDGVDVPRRRVADVVTELPGEAPRPIPAFEETLPNGISYVVLDTENDGPFDNVGPYKVPEGKYFVLGDNRDNSTDSRASWGVGYVPFENLLGRVSVIYLSLDETQETSRSEPGFNLLRWDRSFLVPR